jgi:hypothetical protein
MKFMNFFQNNKNFWRRKKNFDEEASATYLEVQVVLLYTVNEMCWKRKTLIFFHFCASSLHSQQNDLPSTTLYSVVEQSFCSVSALIFCIFCIIFERRKKHLRESLDYKLLKRSQLQQCWVISILYTTGSFEECFF